MKKVINRLLVFTLVCGIFFGAMAFLFRNAKHDSISSGDKTFPLCEYIDVSLSRLPVTIVPYEGEEIRVTYQNDLPLDFELGDNKLTITESSRFVISLFAGHKADFSLNMYLPRHVYREISVYTGSGSLEMGRIDGEKLDLTTESGDITCTDVIALTSITTTSGYISANFENIVSGSTIFSRKGDAAAAFPEGSSVAVDFETDSGACVTDLWNGDTHGSRVYSSNGGENTVKAVFEQGTLTLNIS